VRVRVRVSVPLFRVTHFTPASPHHSPPSRRHNGASFIRRCPHHISCAGLRVACSRRGGQCLLSGTTNRTHSSTSNPTLTPSHPHLAHMHMQRVDVARVRSSALIKHDGRHERACGGSGGCRAGIETPAQGILWGEEAWGGCLWSSELHV
jgi:hypothetical protein